MIVFVSGTRPRTRSHPQRCKVALIAASILGGLVDMASLPVLLVAAITP